MTVVIAGKEYRIKSDADEKWLQSVASGVDEAMALVRDRTETVDSYDVAVLTALNLARELVLLRDQIARQRPSPAATPAANESAVDAERLEELIDLAESAVGSEPHA